MYPQQLSLIQVFSKGHHIIHVIHQLLLPKTIKEIYVLVLYEKSTHHDKGYNKVKNKHQTVGTVPKI
jgi:hypothetical protein